jgi:hypothetical protein
VGKNTRGNKEFSREQRLIKENRQLKRELAHLRKQIARIDVDRFEAIKELCQEDEENFKNTQEDPNSNIEALKREWSCLKCKSGWLEIILYSKLGQTFYYRKCNKCDHRTKGKRYNSESVKGIVING